MLLQDEKNQLMTTNVWMKQVGFNISLLKKVKVKSETSL